MLTYRTGAAGTPSAAMAMAAHLLEQTLPLAQAKLRPTTSADRRRPLMIPAYANTIAEVRPDLDPRLAELLGLSPERIPSQEEIANLLAGNRADGKPIAGKQIQRETKSLADELGLRTDRLPLPAEVKRVLAGCRADSGEKLPESRAPQLRSRFLALYGVTGHPGGRQPSQKALSHVISGRRGDGTAVRSGPLLDALTATRARIGYIDLCWSADKSVSLAWAMAPTEAERNLIASAHKEAVASAMRHVESEIGRARKGKAGRDGYDAGCLAWISFDHYTSRPTVEIARSDPVTGEPYTELVTMKVAGRPQLHTHVCVPAVVLTAQDCAGSSDLGRVGSPDFRRRKGRVHEYGHVYQALLRRKFATLGIDVALDMATGAARITAIPEDVRAAFSKRTRNGTAAARAYARDCGLDWDSLDDARKVGLGQREASRATHGKLSRTTLPIGLPGDVKLPSLGGNHKASLTSTRLLHLWIARTGLSTLTRWR